jgi:hypothetical protein
MPPPSLYVYASRFFFSTRISEISPKTVILAPLREVLVPFKKKSDTFEFKVRKPFGCANITYGKDSNFICSGPKN